MFPRQRRGFFSAWQRPAEEITRIALNPHIQQLQPVSQASVRDQVLCARRHAGTRNQPSQPPQAARPEAEHQQVSIRAQNTVYLAQNRVRAIRKIQRVWQQHAIDRVTCDGQSMRLSNGCLASANELFCDQRTPLSA